jgi:hypothetical protein
MNFGKFFGQLSSVVRSSDERQEMNNEDRENEENRQNPTLVSNEERPIQRSLKAETTQDFKAIFSQYDFGLDQKDPPKDSLSKKSEFGLKSPVSSEKIPVKIEAGRNIEGIKLEKTDEKGLQPRVDKQEGVANHRANDREPTQPKIIPLITIKPLLPMRVKKPTVTEQLDKKRQEELEAKFLEELAAKHGVKQSNLLAQQSIDDSLAELDDEAIAQQIGGGNSMSYRNGSFGNFGGAFTAPSGFNSGFEMGHSGPPVEGSGAFFSAAGGKQISINPDHLKAAHSLFGPEDDEPLNEKKDPSAGFVNPFQSVNQSFGPSSNPFGPPPQSNFQKPETTPNTFTKPNPAGVGGFGAFNEPSNGAISFTNGSMTAPVNISDEYLKRAMAMMKDDSDDEKAKPAPGLGFDEDARMGPPASRSINSPPVGFSESPFPNGPAEAHQGRPVLNGKSVKPNGVSVKPISPENEAAHEEPGPKKDISLREHLERISKEPQTNPAAKVKGSAFNYEPQRKAKFEAPIQTRVQNGLPKLTVAIKKPTIKLKTSLSKFYGKVNIDNERYNKVTSNLKKKRKLKGYQEKRVTRNYGHHFLTMNEIYDHLKPELEELAITDVDDFLEQLTIELKHQLSSADVDVGWVEHQLKMLSRKYYNRVKLEGASSSSCLPKNSSLIPYKVDIKNVLTDLYSRHRKENFFGIFSVLRNMIENTFQFDKRVCLMITSITSPSKEKYNIEFTDGWYLAYMELYSNQEKQLTLLNSKECHQEFNNNLILRLILRKILVPGQKIEVSYLKFEKISENQPIYKPVKVEMFYNSVRKLPWDTQMGLQYTEIKPTKLKDIKPCGGIVPMIDVLIIEKRGIKISNHDRDEFMIRMQHSDNERLCINFSLMVVDSLHLDPSYNVPISLHMMTFRGVDPGKYLDINVGQRLQIYGVKMGKSKQHSVTQANFIHQMPWGLHFSENRRNSSTPLDIPLKLRNESYTKILDLRKRDFIPLEEVKDSLLKVMNMTKTDIGEFLISAAVKFVKYSSNLCLFHLYEKHFIQVELRTGPAAKPGNAKDESKAAAPQMSFWERVMRDLTAISESNCELLMFYDLTYANQTKTVDLRSRGKIYIHKFTFDVINDYMLGENFIISNLESSSIERFLISEYKKNKNIKLGDTDTIAQLICDMSKYPLT